MRIFALFFLVVAAAGCQRAAYEPFDRGYDVHFLVAVDAGLPASARPTVVAPVCAVGPTARRLEDRVFPAAKTRAMAVTTLRAGSGEQRISIWEPRTRRAAQGTIHVAGDVWVVLVIGGTEAAPRTRLVAFPFPPHKVFGTIEPVSELPR